MQSTGAIQCQANSLTLQQVDVETGLHRRQQSSDLHLYQVTSLTQQRCVCRLSQLWVMG